MKTALLVTSLLVLQLTFLAATIYLKPTDSFGPLYLLWVLIPSTIAAIGFAPRLHFVAAIANGLVATVAFDYLFLRHGYFWPEPRAGSTALAIGNIVIGVVLSSIVAGFIHAIIVKLDQTTTRCERDRIGIALGKGIVFSTICAISSAPFLFFLVPSGPQSRFPATVAAGILAVGVVVIGTIISAMVGLTYRPRKSSAPNTQTLDTKLLCQRASNPSNSRDHDTLQQGQ